MSNFTIDARTIFQIGRESIESVTLAVSEVIKNSYDADASFCKIIIDKNKVTFHDDGVGMSYKSLEDNWLRIGTNNKVKSPYTDRGRRKIGEKGIGRFAINRIGNVVEIYTKTQEEKSYLKINFNDFSEGKNLQDVSVVLQHIEDFDEKEINLGKHGTIIVISDLLEDWDEQLIEKIKLECSKLTAVNKTYVITEQNELIFDKKKIGELKQQDHKDEFEIEIENNKYSEKESIQSRQIENYIDYSLFRMIAHINTSSMEYEYKFSFHPYDGMNTNGLRQKLEYGNDFITDISKRGKVQLLDKDISLGEIVVELFAYDFSSIVNHYSPVRKLSVLKQIVKQNGGVKVYRDGQRVYNYGEPGIDWLELDSRRVNRPGRFLSNNVLIGNIYLDRNATSDLEEKTNREGFIDNSEYKYFKKIIQSIVYEFSAKVEDIKYQIKKYLGEMKTTFDYNDTIELLSSKIELITSINEEDRKELIDGLFLVKKQLDYIKDVMLNTSIEVMDYLTIMHDLEKNLEEIKELVNNQDYGDFLKKLVIETNLLVSNQNNLIRDKSKKDYPINDLLNEITYRMRYKFSNHNIELLQDYSQTLGDNLKINKSSLVRIFDNLINNSIYWMNGCSDIIKVSTQKTDKSIIILIEDTGSGFTGDLDYLKEPFITKKIDDTGLGLGLFIVGELMKSAGGSYEISNESSLKKGSAMVKLIFPR